MDLLVQSCATCNFSKLTMIACLKPLLSSCSCSSPLQHLKSWLLRHHGKGRFSNSRAEKRASPVFFPFSPWLIEFGTKTLLAGALPCLTYLLPDWRDNLTSTFQKLHFVLLFIPSKKKRVINLIIPPISDSDDAFVFHQREESALCSGASGLVFFLLP